MTMSWLLAGRNVLLTLVLVEFVFCFLSADAGAQITPDATLENERSRLLPNRPLRNQVVDRIEGGAVRGTNLFHSFQEFNVREGQQVYFANPTGIANILSRVTGTNPSHILGTLGVDGGANLFLLNPNGVLFGANARLDVGGSFVASTGSRLVFPDGSEFSATNPQAPPLLQINILPGLQYGRPIGNLTNSGVLSVGKNQSLTLFGQTVTHSGKLLAPSGQVEILGDRVALVDQALVDVSGVGGGGQVLLGGDFQGKGTVPNARRTFVGSQVRINADAIGAGQGGKVIVWADDSTRFYGTISSRGGARSGNGGFVEVSGKQTLDFAGQVDTSAAKGLTGTLLLDPTNIEVVNLFNAETLNLANVNQFNDPDIGSDGDTKIAAEAISFLATANVLLQASNTITFTAPIDIFDPGVGLTAQAGNQIIVNNSITTDGGMVRLITGNPGRRTTATERIIINNNIFSNGGDVVLRTQGAVQVNDANILTRANQNRNAGNISIQADRLIQRQGRIGAVTEGTGRGGNIDIQARDVDLQDGGGSNFLITGNAPENVSGGGGNLTITTDRLSIRNSLVGAISFNAKDAGNVNIQASEMELVGATSDLFSYSQGRGNSGQMSITTRQLSVQDGARIRTDAVGGGNAGTIKIQAADFINLLNGGTIRAVSNGSGAGGNIELTAENLTVNGSRNGLRSAINSSSLGMGNAGNILLRVANGVNVLNEGVVTTGTLATGRGGDLSITTRSLNIASGGKVFTSSLDGRVYDFKSLFPKSSQQFINQLRTRINAAFQAKKIQGDSGKLTVLATDAVTIDDGTLSTLAGGSASGGAITLQTGTLTIQNIRNQVGGISSEATGQGNGSDIRVRADALLLKQGGLISSRNSGQGRAGNIAIALTNNLQANQGEITATSQRAGGGDITVNANDIRLRDSSLISVSVFDSTGGGGNINLNSKIFLALEDSDILANAKFGPGGNITINSPAFVADLFSGRATAVGRNPGSFERFRGNGRVDISVDSEFGSSGTLDIPNVDPGRGLVALPVALVDPSQRILPTCVSQGKGTTRGSYVETGHGGLPSNPGDVQTDEPVMADLATVDESAPQRSVRLTTAVSPPGPMVEATDWVRDRDGTIRLVANPEIASPQPLWSTAYPCAPR